MGLAYMAVEVRSGRLGGAREGGFFGGQLLHDLGPAEVLREIVDLDDVLAQRFLALPLRALFRRQNAFLSGGNGNVDSRMAVELAGFDGFAHLPVDRLAGDSGE